MWIWFTRRRRTRVKPKKIPTHVHESWYKGFLFYLINLYVITWIKILAFDQSNPRKVWKQLPLDSSYCSRLSPSIFSKHYIDTPTVPTDLHLLLLYPMPKKQWEVSWAIPWNIISSHQKQVSDKLIVPFGISLCQKRLQGPDSIKLSLN